MNTTGRKVNSREFFSRNPVFSLDLAVRELAPSGERERTRARLRYHLNQGALKLLARGLYAVVPAGVTPEDFQPDPFLTAAAERPDSLFCHHSALELLGSAHSVWHEFTVYTRRRRTSLPLGNGNIRFLQHPTVMIDEGEQPFAARRVEHRGRMLVCTSPERILVEGFRRPSMVGGHEELLISTSGIPALDLDLLQEVLLRYQTAKLWAATGWFLESFRNRFHVSDEILQRWADRAPASPQYLERSKRGGRFFRRWNLVVPIGLDNLGGPDEP